MSLVSDTHGDFSRFYKINHLVPEDEKWGVIILGDAGLNFWLSKKDKKNKYRICQKYPKLYFFCVRGNHEERPENIDTMKKLYLENIKGEVYWEPEYPNIFYLIDGNEYKFGDYSAIICGGAYSIDKYYRLERQAAGGYGGWFPQEQLSEEERNTIINNCRDKSYDFILAHTCPWEWEPRDLFLSFIDQSKVDESMELWLSEFVKAVNYKVFLCGHFHDDRILAPHAEMLSLKIKPLDDIMRYWNGI